MHGEGAAPVAHHSSKQQEFPVACPKGAARRSIVEFLAATLPVSRVHGASALHLGQMVTAPQHRNLSFLRIPATCQTAQGVTCTPKGCAAPQLKDLEGCAQSAKLVLWPSACCTHQSLTSLVYAPSRGRCYKTSRSPTNPSDFP